MIHVENLVKTFGEVKAVDGISFDVAAGEIFAFLGPNGAGKTTTIQMLTTLQRPTSGSMKLDGLDPATQPLQARSRFGIVFQDPEPRRRADGVREHGPARRALPRPAKGPHRRIHTLLTLFELWDRRDSFVKTFSGGMKRRLEIARGLLHTPKILFLDEPTLGLDPQSRNQLWTHVKHLNETEGRDGLPDDALHGRSRADGASDRHHRSRSHRRAGHGAGAQAADRRRFARRRRSSR